MSDRESYDLYWGDFHKHATGPGTDIDRMDETVEDAKEHIDVYPVLCYPFEWHDMGTDSRIIGETVGNRPKYEDWWDTIESTAERHHDPGEFVTFPAFEWNGNRTRWGDRNVIYFEEGYPLDDAWTIEELYENLADRRAFAIPHHTGYQVEFRGQDWDAYDPDLSPVTEVYSVHGSSEGVDTPVSMEQNSHMGPRTNGGTFIDALNHGHRVGAIASNDGGGLPGSWDSGVAGIWAIELTREGIWEAIENRRTYGVTGDRMKLWWEMNDAPLGSVLIGASDLEATVNVESLRPLDRIELIHNGSVIESYSHHDGRAQSSLTEGRYSILVEMGWGPDLDYGDFDDPMLHWNGVFKVEDGSLASVQPRFTGFGQSYSVTGDKCQFDLTTEHNDNLKEGFIVEFDADADTWLTLELDDGEEWSVSVDEAVEQSHLIVREDWIIDTVEADFGLDEEDVENRDPYFHNAPKIDIHPAYPRRACTAEVTFDNLPQTGDDYYYVRTSQIDGQYAWASPIWAEA
ncbi:DUF3604 domain-containing protein [Saliphagus sp. LR7]|uniref:DUF3604 domain-containing protein n=1 Tax=Saliphagus sp. LR7 TaxID=2282654 RepID=UPI000DF72D67|nr:DUF3604 domain-containing protein [Saliphagus sp. LR7]